MLFVDVMRRVEEDVQPSSVGDFSTGETSWRAGAVKSNWQWVVDDG
jgi:hypothetical protein